MESLDRYTLISIIDFLLLPFYLAVIFKIAYSYRDKYYKRGHPWRAYFIPALTFKIIGALFISFVFAYYYGGGDTVNIYNNAYYINKSFEISPSAWLDLITRSSDPSDPRYYSFSDELFFFKDKATYTVCVITAIINLFTFNSFIITAVIFASLSFTGIWAIFRAFATLYPRFTRPMAFATIFIPSLIVWGSGIFKDTVCIFALGWLFFSTVKIIAYKDYRPANFVIATLTFLLLVKIKLYIAMSFVPALLLWIFFYYSKNIQNSYARTLAKVIFIGITSVSVIIGLSQFSKELGKYSLEKILQTSATTRDYINYISGDEGSAYSLGDVGSGIGGMLAKFPAAVNVTLFRPYPWEARKPIVALTALEALLFLFLTLKVLFKTGIKSAWESISKDPTIQFCLVFTLIFAFAVGLSSYNFGTLSRYKIPCLPFYAAALILIYYDKKEIKKKLLPFF
jgi:hypothetical protein